MAEAQNQSGAVGDCCRSRLGKPSDIRKLIRERDYLRGKANKTGSHILRQAFNHMRMKVNYAIRDARRKYYIKKIDENEGNLKQT